MYNFEINQKHKKEILENINFTSNCFKARDLESKIIKIFGLTNEKNGYNKNK